MYQNDISQLPKLESTRYENIFNVYETIDGYYYYNILSKVSTPINLDPQYLTFHKIVKVMPWTTLSYNIYGTQYLWWLLCVINKIKNPTKMLQPGQVFAAITPEYVPTVLNNLQV